MKDRNYSSYTPNMDVPTEQKKQNRALPAILLTIILPPLGILLMWRKGIFRMRGRAVITLLATIEMAIIFAAMSPEKELVQIQPVPQVPVAVTQAPNDTVVTALSNIDQLLAQQQAQMQGNMPAATEAPTDEEVAEAAEQAARQQAIDNTIVYSVYNNARYYHAAPDCEGQTNRRQLTVQQAKSEGLGVCPKCNPPF
ncbi:MAG: hypothetical protein IJA26_06420 [Clostridia bacterium]|nr:hypothetical protein [Clostridia bacterium]